MPTKVVERTHMSVDANFNVYIGPQFVLGPKDPNRKLVVRFSKDQLNSITVKQVGRIKWEACVNIKDGKSQQYIITSNVVFSPDIAFELVRVSVDDRKTGAVTVYWTYREDDGENSSPKFYINMYTNMDLSKPGNLSMQQYDHR